MLFSISIQRFTYHFFVQIYLLDSNTFTIILCCYGQFPASQKAHSLRHFTSWKNPRCFKYTFYKYIWNNVDVMAIDHNVTYNFYPLLTKWAFTKVVVILKSSWKLISLPPGNSVLSINRHFLSDEHNEDLWRIYEYIAKQTITRWLHKRYFVSISIHNVNKAYIL